MIDHEGEEIVLVDAHDDGAVHSPRNKTPEAAGTTEAADAKKLERLLAFGGPPKSGPPSASCCEDGAMEKDESWTERRPREPRKEDWFQIVY